MDDKQIKNIKDPIELFGQWLDEAKQSSGMEYPNAMSVATLNNEGEVYSRIVLLKDLRPEGFVFYTNYNSKKGEQIAKHPIASANFYWDSLQKQVKVTGTVEKVSREDSENYWNSRPRESQISQYISQQSQTVESKEILLKEHEEAKTQFKGMPIPCPEHWGGYLIKPKSIEFWIGQPARFHDRFEFRLVNSHWQCRRLYP